MRLGALAALSVAALVAAGCETDSYSGGGRSSSGSSYPSRSGGGGLSDVLGQILGGAGSSTASDRGRYDDRYDRDRRYREEMARIDAEQRRLDAERREVERRYGRDY